MEEEFFRRRGGLKRLERKGVHRRADGGGIEREGWRVSGRR